MTHCVAQAHGTQGLCVQHDTYTAHAGGHTSDPSGICCDNPDVPDAVVDRLWFDMRGKRSVNPASALAQTYMRL
jgi:hypothetical protein